MIKFLFYGDYLTSESTEDITSKLSIIYREDRTRHSMQFIADIIRKLIEDKKLSLVELYNMHEKNIINSIQNSNYKL